MKSLAVLALAALSVPAALAQPRINLIQNNYSYILPGMPNYGIAQGSIFDIFGTGLGTQTTSLQNVPLQTSLNGTSADITVNSVTTHAILYYVSAAEIAAILPSATPAGSGQVTVTVNGKTSAPAAITVVQSAFGLLSMNGAGNGTAAAYDVNSNFLSVTNAANPGDFITLWGTGVGPVDGDETVTQVPANLTSIPLEVDIGGVSATIQYQGRSIYPGLDQINVQVPDIVGCSVSVVVRSGDIVSNFGSIPVAETGRVCQPVLDISTGQIQTLASQPTVSKGAISFDGSEADAVFNRFTSLQFAVDVPLGGAPFGDCGVSNFVNGNMAVPNPQAFRPTRLDAGPSISMTPPSGSGIGNQVLALDNGSYSVSNVSGTGSSKGTYTFTGGGTDVGQFTAQVDFPGGGSGFNFATPGNSSASAPRSQGLLLTWTQPNHTDATQTISISGYAYVTNMPWGAEFNCRARLAAGASTIPASVLLALPSSSQALLSISLIDTNTFTAPGLDLGFVNYILTKQELFTYQ